MRTLLTITALMPTLIAFLFYVPNFLYALPEENIVSFSSQPNPFDSRNQNATIMYYLTADADAVLKIFDLLGMLVKEYRFSNGENGAKRGWNRVNWNGENDVGRKVSKGGYICFLEVNIDGSRSKGIYKIGVVH